MHSEVNSEAHLVANAAARQIADDHVLIRIPWHIRLRIPIGDIDGAHVFGRTGYVAYTRCVSAPSGRSTVRETDGASMDSSPELNHTHLSFSSGLDNFPHAYRTGPNLSTLFTYTACVFGLTAHPNTPLELGE